MRRELFLPVIFLTALLAVLYISLSLSPYPVTLRDILAFLGGGPLEPQVKAVIDMRLRRAITSIFVGAILGVCTMVLQSSLRNILASPFTLGVQHAASLGAAVALMALYGGSIGRWSITVTNPFVVSGMAFTAAFLQTLLVLGLSSVGGLTAFSIVLISVTMSFVVQAVLSLLQYLYFNEVLVAALLFWTFGDVGRPGWVEVVVLGIAALAVAVFFVLRSIDLDLLMLGDDVAKSSGVNPGRARILLLAVTALATAVSVSFAGVIGFVGLAAGVVARQLVGWSNRKSLPLSAIAGALILTVSDLAGRLIISPIVIPVGVMTTLTGAPVMLYLLVRGKHGKH